MTKLIEKKLPSGKIMKLNISTFDNGTNLYQTILKEGQTLKMDAATDLDEKLLIQIAMLALSSKAIEKAIHDCFDKVVIDGEKLTKDYFEPEENREDYFTVLLEVTKVNLKPFMKGLYAQFSQLFQEGMKIFQA